MYEDWTANLIVVLGTVIAVGASVLVHYEGLNLLSQWLARRRDHHPRRKVLYGIFGVLSLHISEIWIFGLAIWGDFPDAWTALGAAIVIAAGLYMLWGDRKSAGSLAKSSI